jgi:hypothetical protein
VVDVTEESPPPQDPHDWSVPCGDVLGRRRQLDVVFLPKGVMLQAPEGGTALLDRQDLDALLVRLAQHSGHIRPQCPGSPAST